MIYWSDIKNGYLIMRRIIILVTCRLCEPHNHKYENVDVRLIHAVTSNDEFRWFMKRERERRERAGWSKTHLLKWWNSTKAIRPNGKANKTPNWKALYAIIIFIHQSFWTRSELSMLSCWNSSDSHLIFIFIWFKIAPGPRLVSWNSSEIRTGYCI